MPKNSVLTTLQSSGIWSKLERWKSLISGYLVSWPQIKKIPTTMNYFLTWLWHATKSGFHMTTRDNQLSDWTTKKPQSTFKAKHTKKKGRGHCMLVCGPSDPLQLSESWQNHSIYKYALQIEEMHQKLPHLQPTLVNSKAPIFLHDNAPPHSTQPTLQQLNELGYKVLSHLWYLADLSPTTTFSSISTTFFSEHTFTTSRRQKVLSKSSLNPEAQIFML